MSNALIDNKSDRWKLLAFDVAAVFVFALLAHIAHRGDNPFSFLKVLDIFWPFLLGLLIGWAILIFRQLPPQPFKPSGLIVWGTTVVTGLFIWGLRHAAFPHWSFILVASIMSALLLIGWRYGVAKLSRS